MPNLNTMTCSNVANQHPRRPKHTATTSSPSDAAADGSVQSGMSRRKDRTIAPCRGTSSAGPGKATTKLATICRFFCGGVGDFRSGCRMARCRLGGPRGACETAGCEVGDRRGSCKTAGGKVNDLRGGCKTAGCTAPSEPARGPQGLLPRGCRAGESAGPARGLMLRGRRAGECAGAAAGAGEDEGADGAGTERPSSSCTHSVESSICAGGTGAKKPTNSHSHSAESSSSGADGTAAMRQKGDKARASRPEGKATTRRDEPKCQRRAKPFFLHGPPCGIERVQCRQRRAVRAKPSPAPSPAS